MRLEDKDPQIFRRRLVTTKQQWKIRIFIIKTQKQKSYVCEIAILIVIMLSKMFGKCPLKLNLVGKNLGHPYYHIKGEF
jgi:hypothetical protein